MALDSAIRLRLKVTPRKGNTAGSDLSIQHLYPQAKNNRKVKVKKRVKEKLIKGGTKLETKSGFDFSRPQFRPTKAVEGNSGRAPAHRTSCAISQKDETIDCKQAFRHHQEQTKRKGTK
jgi:hypothetical protein